MDSSAVPSSEGGSLRAKATGVGTQGKGPRGRRDEGKPVSVTGDEGMKGKGKET